MSNYCNNKNENNFKTDKDYKNEYNILFLNIITLEWYDTISIK